MVTEVFRDNGADIFYLEETKLVDQSILVE